MIGNTADQKGIGLACRAAWSKSKEQMHVAGNKPIQLANKKHPGCQDTPSFFGASNIMGVMGSVTTTAAATAP